MNKKRIFFFFIFLTPFNLFILTEKISFKTEEIEEGIYNFVLQKRLSILTYLGGLRTSREKYGFSRLNFKITFSENSNKKFFNIKHVHSGQNLGIKKESSNKVQKETLPLIMNYNLIKNNFTTFEWEFVKEEGKVNSFIIKSKFGCVLQEIKNRFVCSLKEEGTLFSLLRLYQEVEKKISEEDQKILDNEPIDVFIKYIDLHDPNLKRNNLSQITKDQDNEELRYSIRSILKNIPWIRKIFILLPNEKVRFFRNVSDISEKIIYVHDKDILGHESANIHAFQYRIWKLREFGLSENFISMDDDYFIGKPLNKSDLFYVENKKVYPAIINANFELQTMATAEKERDQRKKKMNRNKRTQTSDEFMYTVYRTYIFLIQYFESPIIVPYFTHNAIPVKASDLKEVFDLVNKSEEFREPTLYSLRRHPQSLQYQTTLIVYTFNKYKRKVNKINYNYIDGADTISGKYNFPLFCINTGNNNDYSKIAFMKMKISMEKLFPIPTKYEIYDPEILAENAFNAVKILKNDLKKKAEQNELYQYEIEKYENEKIAIKYETCNEQLEFLCAQNYGYEMQVEKIKSGIEKCKEDYIIKNQKISELEKANEDFGMIFRIKKELKNVKNENKIHVKNINKYIQENEVYLEKINNIKKYEYKMYYIIFFQLILIIGLMVGITFFLIKRNNKINADNKLYGYNTFS